jgi:acetolactate decarboxylase
MDKGTAAAVLVGGGLFVAMIATAETPEESVPDVVRQVGTITALSAGSYDGLVPVADLAAEGDLGLGTFDALDGEMIVLDGTVWQVPVDGVPVEAPEAETTPFAQVVAFHPTTTVDVDDATSCDDLGSRIDEELGDKPHPMVALSVEATFSALEIRSEPAQDEPYRPLSDVIDDDQVTFDLEDVTGAMVGFRTSDDLESVSPPGYHFHMLTDDRAHGGHVLSCTVSAATVEIDLVAGLDLTLGGPAEEAKG